MDVLQTARRTIERHRLMSRDTRVLVAVSGGSDSVALTHLMLDLHRARELQLAGLAHFNHQLRDAAAEDERFCERMAADLGLPFIADRADVAALARDRRTSLENAGRTARHAFFARAKATLHADVVALGHTRDDQAETFLLRLVRGAGARGLASMHPRTAHIVRPLLDCRRAELREFLLTRQVAFVHDASNNDVEIPRNRVRAELLPLLERRFNPKIVDVLAAEAELARDEHAYLTQEAEAFSDEHVRDESGRRFIPAAALMSAPAAIARLVLHRAMVEISGGRSVRFADVERALVLCGTRHGELDAAGHRVQRIGPDLVLTCRPAGTVRHPVPLPANLFTYSLSIPGEVAVPEARCVLATELAPSWEGDFRRLSSGTAQAVIQMSAVQPGAVQLGSHPGLFVRGRRPGDRFQPLGLGGYKKLQDFFVDRKVVREVRDRVPIVVDGAGRIVWVAGYAIDEAFRVTDPAQAVIILRLKGLGGSA